jgi:hypothetical protein
MAYFSAEDRSIGSAEDRSIGVFGKYACDRKSFLAI